MAKITETDIEDILYDSLDEYTYIHYETRHNGPDELYLCFYPSVEEEEVEHKYKEQTIFGMDNKRNFIKEATRKIMQIIEDGENG